MIDLYLLEELVTFARTGTLAKTAAELDLTQPAVTHSMKKLENELQVQLFRHEPNKIYLTETGKYTAREAKKLLDNNQNFIQKIKKFDQSQTQITVAVNAPGPRIVLDSLKNDKIKIESHFIEHNFEVTLLDQQVNLLIINQPLKDRDLESTYLGTEKMSVNLPKNCVLTKKKSLLFKDLKGKTIMSPEGIGFWQTLYEKRIPNAKFIFQSQSNEYSEILNYSILPYFTTNITTLDDAWGKNLPGDRVERPLNDAVAQQKFYACYLKRNKSRLMPLIEEIQDQWAKVD